MDDEHILVVGDSGLIFRWNGKNWTEFYAGTDHFLFDIWGGMPYTEAHSENYKPGYHPGW